MSSDPLKFVLRGTIEAAGTGSMVTGTVGSALWRRLFYLIWIPALAILALLTAGPGSWHFALFFLVFGPVAIVIGSLASARRWNALDAHLRELVAAPEPDDGWPSDYRVGF
jgi:hypothetical protein